MAEFQLDFDQVAEAGLRTRQRPTMAVSQLAATQQQSLFVLACQRWHHEAWHLPLWDREVRYWLKQQVFAQAPHIVVGGVEVACGKEVAP